MENSGDKTTLVGNILPPEVSTTESSPLLPDDFSWPFGNPTGFNPVKTDSQRPTLHNDTPINVASPRDQADTVSVAALLGVRNAPVRHPKPPVTPRSAERAVDRPNRSHKGRIVLLATGGTLAVATFFSVTGLASNESPRANDTKALLAVPDKTANKGKAELETPMAIPTSTPLLVESAPTYTPKDARVMPLPIPESTATIPTASPKFKTMPIFIRPAPATHKSPKPAPTVSTPKPTPSSPETTTTPSPTETTPSPVQTFGLEPGAAATTSLELSVDNGKKQELLNKYPTLAQYLSLDYLKSNNSFNQLSAQDILDYQAATDRLYAIDGMSGALGDPAWMNEGWLNANRPEIASQLVANADRILQNAQAARDITGDLSSIDLTSLNKNYVNDMKNLIQGGQVDFSSATNTVNLSVQRAKLQDTTEVILVATSADYTDNNGNTQTHLIWSMAVPINQVTGNTEKQAFVGVRLTDEVLLLSAPQVGPIVPQQTFGSNHSSDNNSGERSNDNSNNPDNKNKPHGKPYEKGNAFSNFFSSLFQ
jgi:hypothetical protein